MSKASTCYSLIGSFGAYFRKGTSSEVLNEVAKELFFFIRINMSSGHYESENVLKIIFLEKVNASFLEPSTPKSNAKALSTNVLWLPESDGGGSSVITAVMSLLLAFLIGLTMFISLARKKRLEKESAMATAQANHSGSDAATSTCVSTSVEGHRAKAYKAEDVWKYAMNIYSSEEKATKGSSLVRTKEAKEGVKGMSSERCRDTKSNNTLKSQDEITADTGEKIIKRELNEALVSELDLDGKEDDPDSDSLEEDKDELAEGRQSSGSGMDSFQDHGNSINNSSWTAYQDDNGEIYYHNYITGESSWNPPPGLEDINVIEKSSSEDITSICGREDCVQQETDAGSEDSGFTQKESRDGSNTLEPPDDEKTNKTAEHEEAEHEVHDMHEQSFQSLITENTTDSMNETNIVEGSGNDHPSDMDNGAFNSRVVISSSPQNTTNEEKRGSTSNSQIPDQKTGDECQRLTSADYDLD